MTSNINNNNNNSNNNGALIDPPIDQPIDPLTSTDVHLKPTNNLSKTGGGGAGCGGAGCGGAEKASGDNFPIHEEENSDIPLENKLKSRRPFVKKYYEM
jgi:hypothetical protein